MIADVQVRNRGTIGGNVCTGDPTNHFPPLMVALGAEMTVRGSDGERRVPAEEFFLGVYMTQAGPGELLTRITVPAADGRGDGFAIVPIGRDGTAIVNAAACVRANGTIQEARVALGCVDAVPVRQRARVAPRRRRPAESAVKEAAKGIASSLDPPSDVHASARLPATPRRGRRGPGRRRGSREGPPVSAQPVTCAFVTVTVNGTTYEREVDARRLLVHFLRDDLDLTGTHIGCDTGNCGACTILFNGQNVKWCMLLAVQADGADDHDRRGPRRRRRPDAAPGGVLASTTRCSAATARPGC